MSSTDRLIGGRYRIVRKIAEGGMGAVYEAQHNLSKKTVALKILFPHIGRDEAARQRFLREVSAPAQIGHDGIVEVLDAGFDIEDGSLFVAMELLDGEPLRDRLAKGGMSLDLLLDTFERILDPLAAAHAKGIVHRDLKPENVFIAKKRDGSTVVKVLDFGIARDLDSSQNNVTHTGIAMGTPHYMAPEQAMSAKGVNAAADVWALGVMLYEALVGRPPFDGETPSAIVVLACTQAHAPVAQLAPDVPRPLSDFVDRCLRKDPRDRPRDAGQMLAELRQVRQQIGSVPGVATASAGMAALTSVPAAGPTPPGRAAPHGGTAVLPQTPGSTFGTPSPNAFGTPQGGFGAHGAFGTPAPGGYGAGGYDGAGAFGGTPNPSGGAFVAQPGTFGTSVPASGYASTPGGAFSAPGAFAPPAKSGGGLAMGLVVAVLVGGLLVVGGGIAVAVMLLDDDEPTTPVVSYANVRIQTNVPAGELFVNGSSRGPVVPNQLFRIERGSHRVEIRENGTTVATAHFVAIAGQNQTLVLNRSATPIDSNPMLPGNVQTLTGELRPGDMTRAHGEYADSYYFDWVAGTTVRIELDSTDFDTELIVTSPSGVEHQNDDRPGGGLNSGLTLTIGETGRWHVQCSSWQSQATGTYTLRVHSP